MKTTVLKKFEKTLNFFSIQKKTEILTSFLNKDTNEIIILTMSEKNIVISIGYLYFF